MSKICPDNCFSGFPAGCRGTQICQKFVENFENLSGNYRFFSNIRHIFDTFGPHDGRAPKNNRRAKFLTNLGFGAFLNAVRQCKGKKGSQDWHVSDDLFNLSREEKIRALTLLTQASEQTMLFAMLSGARMRKRPEGSASAGQ